MSNVSKQQTPSTEDSEADSDGVPLEAEEEEHTAPLESQTRPLAYQPIGDVLWGWAQAQKREAA